MRVARQKKLATKMSVIRVVVSSSTAANACSRSLSVLSVAVVEVK